MTAGAVAPGLARRELRSQRGQADHERGHGGQANQVGQAQRGCSPHQSAEGLLNGGASGEADRGHGEPPISILNGPLGVTRHAKKPGTSQGCDQRPGG